MMNHEESNESRDESRESTPAAPGLRLGFPRFKNLSHQRGFLQAIHSRGAKAPGRHGRLQGLFVVTFFYFGKIHPRTMRFCTTGLDGSWCRNSCPHGCLQDISIA
jgi:hypothetical protein